MEQKISKQIDKFLSNAVRKSLSKSQDPDKWSIKECAKNEYLDPAYDPFKMLEFTLMAYSIRSKYGYGTSSIVS